MAKRFAEIAFTPSVKSVQEQFGSRNMNSRFEIMPDPGNEIGPAEKAFIEARDSFYQATTNPDGWPYVQFRGGPTGFLKVLDDRHIGYADFRGNRQYISVGNMTDNNRISMILMDYPHRRRLKIWGEVSLVEVGDRPDLFDVLQHPDYRARVERAVIIRTEAVEWNCPAHITPRYTAEEIEQAQN